MISTAFIVPSNNGIAKTANYIIFSRMFVFMN